MKKFYQLTVLLCFLSFNIYAQEGHRIAVDIEDYSEKELYLGFYYGDKTLIQDTAKVNKEGTFVFSGEEALKPGMYIVVLAPDNNYFQILVDENEQFFSIKTTKAELAENLKFENAIENARFYDYLSYLKDLRPAMEKLQKQMAESTDDKEKEKIQNELNSINDKVRVYQDDLIEKHPNSFTALIIKANRGVDMPEFEGTPEEIQRKAFYYRRDHYFDNLNLADPRLIRTLFFFQQIETYVEKLHYQMPDSVIQAVDKVLNGMKPAEDNFKFFLIHYLNKYAASKIVGMDAVYVHLALNYYGKGLADWTEEEQLEKIIQDAKDLEPLLIGKKAPNVKRLQKQDGSTVNLYDLDSEYTILYFWRYDCGHCKKSTPFMRDFYNKFKDKGVKILSICTKQGKEIPGCWEYIKENEIEDWMHTVDPYGLYMLDYKVKTTPQMYILNKDKEIIMKKIGAEQLEEVMDKIIEMNKKESEQD